MHKEIVHFKWRLFSFWCRERHLDVNWPLCSVLEFSQDHFSAGLTPSTIKVYVVAICATHILMDRASLGRHLLVSHFHKMSKVSFLHESSFLPWVLVDRRSLYGTFWAPDVTLWERSLKVAITLFKRVVGLQDLSIASFRLEFAPGGVKVILHLSLLPQFHIWWFFRLSVLCLFNLWNRRGLLVRLNLLCPVQALSIYVHSSGQWHKSQQLFFVCFGAYSRVEHAWNLSRGCTI